MSELAYLVVLVLCAVFFYGYYLGRPDTFSWASIGKSLTFLGMLALVLMLFIAVVIMLLRAEV